jgi:hypothetical protein
MRSEHDLGINISRRLLVFKRMALVAQREIRALCIPPRWAEFGRGSAPWALLFA